MNILTPLDIGIAMGLVFAWSVLALALAFRLFHFPDLTVEGSLPLGAAIFGVLVQRHGLPLAAAIPAAMLGGAAAGALTALILIRFRLNKFLAGILVIAVTYSLSLRVMDGSNIGLLQTPSFFSLPIIERLDELTLAGASIHMGSILVLALMAAAGAAILVVGLSSRRGMRMRVAGSNPVYARSLGISVPKYLVIGLAFTNSLAALSGCLLSMWQGFCDISMGQGILILCLAAITIGERLIPSKAISTQAFVVCAAIIGSIAYQVLVAYAVRFGFAPTDLKLVTAVLVLGIVAFRMTGNGEFFEESVR